MCLSIYYNVKKIRAEIQECMSRTNKIVKNISKREVQMCTLIYTLKFSTNYRYRFHHLPPSTFNYYQRTWTRSQENCNSPLDRDVLIAHIGWVSLPPGRVSGPNTTLLLPPPRTQCISHPSGLKTCKKDTVDHCHLQTTYFHEQMQCTQVNVGLWQWGLRVQKSTSLTSSGRDFRADSPGPFFEERGSELGNVGWKKCGVRTRGLKTQQMEWDGQTHA